MIPAPSSKRLFESTRLMIVRSPSPIHTTLSEIVSYLSPGDLLIVNQSGTLPSSFRGTIVRTGEPVEVRLASFRGRHPSNLSRWAAVSFGKGDWRLPTERRTAAPELVPGDTVEISSELILKVLSIDPEFSRLLEIEFQSKRLISSLFQSGRPIQYSYLQEELQVWDQQTLFAGPPISVEPPSASFQLNWSLTLRLQQSGVVIAPILHGAGLSSTGDPALDARFPLDEYFDVPNETIDEIRRAKARGSRIVAAGTTVVRAVESAFTGPNRRGRTSLKLDSGRPAAIVDTLLTGMHEPGTSHARLMQGFCGCHILEKAQQDADRLQYRSHEYGDLALLDCKAEEKMSKSISIL